MCLFLRPNLLNEETCIANIKVAIWALQSLTGALYGLILRYEWNSNFIGGLRVYGKVTRYYKNRGYGFIYGEDGNTYFVHHSKLKGASCIIQI